LLAGQSSRADAGGYLDLTTDLLAQEDASDVFSRSWLYHPGDPPGCALPGFDDSGWEPVDSRLPHGGLPSTGWDGYGWFRLHLRVDSDLIGKPLALSVYHSGASEIHLDGLLIHRYGIVGVSSVQEEAMWDSNPRLLQLPDKDEVVLAIRYSSHAAGLAKAMGLPTGFNLEVRDLHEGIAARTERISSDTGYQMYFSGVPMAFALLHLFVFFYDRRSRENLYFAIFSASTAIFVLANFQGRLLTDGVLQDMVAIRGRASDTVALMLVIWRISVVATVLSGTRFLYSVFSPTLPRRFRLFVSVGVCICTWSCIRPIASWNYLNFFLLIVVVEMVRILVDAFLKKKEGSRFLCLGSVGILFGTLYMIIRNLGLMEAIPGFSNFFYCGVLLLLLSMSMYLSRNFAAARAALEKQLDQVRRLSQTNIELQQQRALDRVRAEAAAMLESRDIARAVAALWEGLKTSGLRFEGAAIIVREPKATTLQFYGAVESSGKLVALLPDPGKDLFQREVSPGVNLWRREVPLAETRTLRPKPGAHLVDDHFKAYLKLAWGISDPEGTLSNRMVIETTFAHGYLALLARDGTRFSDQDLGVVELFAAAISLGYARYFDLQKLEVQNRALMQANRDVHQANLAKSAFLANMSHELRTPLNSVIAMSDILLEKYFGELTERQEEYIRSVRESGDHLLSLINDVLDLSKVEAGHSPLEPSQVDLANLLGGSLAIVRERAHNHGIILTCEAPDGLPTISADERKVKQIVFNLLSNAVKFTPDGGRVGIEAVAKENEVWVCVWDTGIGIAEEDQEKVFEQFEQAESSMTRRFEGTGLGLALVKRFVEQHGGRVWLESEPDRGSRFYFALPVELPVHLAIS
jgi:signal transduction histidine kinase